MSAYKELKGINQVVFAVGHIGPGMLSQFITIWLLIFLSGGNSGSVSPILGAGLVGFCIMCGRLVDALSDPIVANWSDRMSGSRWGRRLPFIVIGALPMVISFNMLWYTHLFGGTVFRMIWVLAAVMIFYFSYTVIVNPYFALLPEIASSKRQRTFVQSFVALFGILGMGISEAGGGFLIDALGYPLCGLLLSGFCLLVLTGPILTVRANPGNAVAVDEKSDSNILKSLKNAMSNKTFRSYITGFCIFFLGFQMIQYNLAFITTVLLGLSKGASGTLFITSVVFGLLFIPVYNKILKRVSCSSALKIAIGAYVIIALIIATIPLLMKTGINGQILGYILMAFLGFPYSGLMVIPNVIVSEIIDEDVRLNHVRREALFFGVQGLINKFMAAMAALFVGISQNTFGNTIENPWGVELVAPLAAGIAAIGFVVIGRLHISKDADHD